MDGDGGEMYASAALTYGGNIMHMGFHPSFEEAAEAARRIQRVWPKGYVINLIVKTFIPKGKAK